MEIAGQKCSILKGSIKRLDLQTTNRYRADLSGLFLYDGATPRCSYNVCLYAGQSQRDVKFENS